MKRTRALILAALLAGGVTLAACGDDDAPANQPTGTTTVTDDMPDDEMSDDDMTDDDMTDDDMTDDDMTDDMSDDDMTETTVAP